MTRRRVARSRICQSMPKRSAIARKPGLQRRQIDREIGGGEHHPHEEMAGLDVVELLGVENVLPVMGQKRRHRGDDAGTIRTGQGQHILMIGHGGLDYSLAEGWNGVLAALLYHRPTPLRQSRSRRS